MSVIISTNYSATIAANNLSSSNAMLQKSLNRLSSGQKITSPADDAAGIAESMKLSAAATRSGAVNSNIANTVSLLQTQDGVLKVAGKILDRISELKTLFTDPTKNSNDLAIYDKEFTTLQGELSALQSEKFNGNALFGASYTVNVTEDAGSSVTVANRDLTGTTGVSTIVAGGATSLSNLTLANITDALQNVATFRAANGSEQARLGFASELITSNKTNIEQANSRIIDVDVAQESTQLARYNTLVQAGTAMLAQANTSANTALRLLQ